MADAQAFDFVCDQLEQATGLDRLAARGTVRIALKQAGLEARAVSPEEMGVVLDKLLPQELTTRGVEGGEAVCARIKSGLACLAAGRPAETPDAVFRRLGGGV